METKKQKKNTNTELFRSIELKPYEYGILTVTNNIDIGYNKNIDNNFRLVADVEIKKYKDIENLCVTEDHFLKIIDTPTNKGISSRVSFITNKEYKRIYRNVLKAFFINIYKKLENFIMVIVDDSDHDNLYAYTVKVSIDSVSMDLFINEVDTLFKLFNKMVASNENKTFKENSIKKLTERLKYINFFSVERIKSFKETARKEELEHFKKEPDTFMEIIPIDPVTKKSGMPMMVGRKLISFPTDDRIKIDKNDTFNPEEKTGVVIKRLFNFTDSEFKTMFKDDYDVIKDANIYVQKYIDTGLTFDEITVTIKRIEAVVKNDSVKSTHGRKVKKQLRKVLNELNKIKLTYIIRPDGYVSGHVGSKQSEHYRKGHCRHYTSGKKVWIEKYKAGGNNNDTVIKPSNNEKQENKKEDMMSECIVNKEVNNMEDDRLESLISIKEDLIKEGFNEEAAEVDAEIKILQNRPSINSIKLRYGIKTKLRVGVDYICNYGVSNSKLHLCLNADDVLELTGILAGKQVSLSDDSENNDGCIMVEHINSITETTTIYSK